MTGTTSTTDNKRALGASFFRQYLRHNLTQNRVYLLISLITSIIAVVGVIVSMIYFQETLAAIDDMSAASVEGAVMFPYFFGWVSICALYLLSLTSGVRCFQFLTRANKTDTLMSLPLTHRERFWGDFLTGYLTSAAPIIPCWILGIIIAAIAKGDYLRFALVYGATLLFVTAFAYVLSVLAAALCGKRSGGYMAAALLAIITALFMSGWGTFFQYNILGHSIQSTDDLAAAFAEFIPSPALLPLDDFLCFTDYYKFTEKDFPVESPLKICIYALLIAAAIVAAYFISKHRHTEHTGEFFAAKHSATVVTVISAVTAAGLCAMMSIGSVEYVVLIVCAIGCIVAFLTAELILRRGVRKLPKRVGIYAAATAVTLGFALVVMVTRGLGASNYVPAADKVESAEITTNTGGKTTYTLNNEKEIKRLCESHSDLLKNNMADLDTGNYLTIKYTLKNGKEMTRQYCALYMGDSAQKMIKYSQTQEALLAIPKSLDSYAKQYSAPLDDAADRIITVNLGGVRKTLKIDPQKSAQFAQILKSDIEQFYSPDSLPIGRASFTLADEKTTQTTKRFEILSSYRNTLAFLEYDSNLSKDNEPYTEYRIAVEQKFLSAEINIMSDELDTPAVKELEALLRSANPNDYNTIYSDEFMSGLRVYSQDYYQLYIPNEDIPKALALISEIASASI